MFKKKYLCNIILLLIDIHNCDLQVRYLRLHVVRFNNFATSA